MSTSETGIGQRAAAKAAKAAKAATAATATAAIAATMRIDFRMVAATYLGQYPSARSFREHFGATHEVAAATWEWLDNTGTVPAKAKPCHLLWLFYWWKSNALQDPCCRFLGGIDKNTFIKWRDRMEEVVSNLPVVSPPYHNNVVVKQLTKSHVLCRSIGMIDMKAVALDNMPLLQSTVLTSLYGRYIHLIRIFGHSS